MASTLFFQTNQINEHLTLLYHPLCIRWNQPQQKWEYSLENKTKLLPHLFFTIFVPGFLIISVVFFIILSIIYDPELYSTKQIIIQLLIGSIIPFVFMLEILLLFYGRELVATANWGIPHVIRLRLVERPKLNTSFITALLEEISKITSSETGKNVEWFSLLSSNFLIITFVMTLVIPITLAFQKLDPLYVISSGISSKRLLNGPTLDHLFFFKFCQYVGMIYIYQCNLLTLTYCMSLVLSVMQVGVKLILYLNQMQVSYSQVKLYRQVRINVYMMYTMIKILNGTFFSFAFVLLIFSINLSIFGWDFLPFEIYIIVPLIMMITLIITTMGMYVDSFIFEITSKTLIKWKGQIHEVARVKYMRRVLRSMRPISLPIGDVGIIDKDIKVNYLDALMIYIANSLIACKNFI